MSDWQQEGEDQTGQGGGMEGGQGGGMEEGGDPTEGGGMEEGGDPTEGGGMDGGEQARYTKRSGRAAHRRRSPARKRRAQ